MGAGAAARGARAEPQGGTRSGARGFKPRPPRTSRRSRGYGSCRKGCLRRRSTALPRKRLRLPATFPVTMPPPAVPRPALRGSSPRILEDLPCAVNASPCSSRSRSSPCSRGDEASSSRSSAAPGRSTGRPERRHQREDQHGRGADERRGAPDRAPAAAQHQRGVPAAGDHATTSTNIRVDMQGRPSVSSPANGQPVLWQRETGRTCPQVQRRLRARDHRVGERRAGADLRGRGRPARERVHREPRRRHA